MSINIDTTYRINRNLDQDEKMRYLVRELRIFNNYSQILTISALIGYANNAFVPFTERAEAVQTTFFEDRENFEFYANGGFPILCKKLGVDFVDRSKNDRYKILHNYYKLLVTSDLIDI